MQFFILRFYLLSAHDTSKLITLTEMVSEPSLSQNNLPKQNLKNMP